MREGLRNFSPAYFALVMATGIVSIAAQLLERPAIASALFWINIAAYVVLIVLTILRAAWHRPEFTRDLTDHLRAPGFFTSVAATCVLGSQFAIIARQDAIATALWIVGIILWLGLTYTIFTAFTVKEEKPTLAAGISGAWLIAVVATQSVAVLAATMAPRWDDAYRPIIDFFALSMWLWGAMLYIWMISLIFYRYTFFPFTPSDLSPPYWINMGATAISTLAGSLLILNAHEESFLQSLLPFIRGFTVFYWATGTWWIPMLILLGIWRHVVKRFPLRYDPLYWGAVFPLGMYTVCTFQMSKALDLPFLMIVPRYFFFIALAAWLLTFVGLVRTLVRGVSSRA